MFNPTVRTSVRLTPIYLAAALIAAALSGCTSYGADRDAQQACQGFAPGTADYANCYAVTFAESQASRRAAVSASLLQTQQNMNQIYSQPSYKPVTCYTAGSTVTCY